MKSLSRKTTAVAAALGLGATSVIGGVVFTQMANAKSDGTCNTSLTMTPTVLYNVGGKQVQTGAHNWVADAQSTGGQTLTSAQGKDVAGTVMDELYRDVRVGDSFSYNLAVPNGYYLVRLHFAALNGASETDSEDIAPTAPSKMTDSATPAPLDEEEAPADTDSTSTETTESDAATDEGSDPVAEVPEEGEETRPAEPQSSPTPERAGYAMGQAGAADLQPVALRQATTATASSTGISGTQNINIERGMVELKDFDVSKEAGKDTALVRGFETKVTDGNLTVTAVAGSGLANLAAIEAWSISNGCQTQPEADTPTEDAQAEEPANRTAPEAETAPSTEAAAPAPAKTGVSSGTGYHGWSSGVSGENSTLNEFATWRGSPVGVVGTWNDTDASVQTDLYTVSNYDYWDGDLETTVGGIVRDSGETLSAAAGGAYDARWREAAENLKKMRGEKSGVTYVRPFHEFNGNWYPWSVNNGNVEDFKKAFVRLAKIYREVFPEAKMVWGPNNDTSDGSFNVLDSYPGDEYVDVIGVDSYNANGSARVLDDASWAEYRDKKESNGAPYGVEPWRLFAQEHGKAMSFPEWGLNAGGGGGDDPYYIKKMNDWMTEHAAKPGDSNVAGKIVYDIYFNVRHGGTDTFLIKGGPHVEAAKMYQSLKWGNNQ